MITIQKNTSNVCVFTLNEKQTTTDHYWLFKFTHTVTGEDKIFTADDVSLYPRWNEFVITDSVTEDATEGVMTFELGDHTYSVYEMPESSPISLDPDDALTIVETGLVNVYDPNVSDPNSFDVDSEKNSGQFDEE